MGLKKWVQHISGQGKKWEVLSEYPHGWKVPVPVGKGMGGETWFPKSEYHLCEPPEEEWEDVTEQCKSDRYRIGDDKFLLNLFNDSLGETVLVGTYRLRKVRCAKAMGANNPDWAFIVERKKS